jgi:hypothetical protein
MAKEFKGPDPKPTKRVKDKKVMKRMHTRGVICVLCGKPGSIHHVYDRSDVPENLVGLCGSGTTGHHGYITGEDEQTRRELGEYILLNRDDIIFYVIGKLGEEAGKEWLLRRLFLTI